MVKLAMVLVMVMAMVLVMMLMVTMLTLMLRCSFAYSSDNNDIPNLIGTWTGVNKTLSEQRGFRSWEKKVEITEQKDRRFKGTFSHTDGTKNFFGVPLSEKILIIFMRNFSIWFRIMFKTFSYSGAAKKISIMVINIVTIS